MQRWSKNAMAAAFACACAAAMLDARAEMTEINVAEQYGISYLPLMLMEEQKVIEKHAKAAGVDVKVGWAKFAGGNVMNDALLSGSLQFASGGVGPLVTLWARTRGNLDVRSVGALNSMPLYPSHAIRTSRRSAISATAIGSLCPRSRYRRRRYCCRWRRSRRSARDSRIASTR